MDSAFEFTTRARPLCQIGIGDARVDTGLAMWDVARWDDPDATWASSEPYWLDVSCDTIRTECAYGRAATTDRFVAGTATVIVNNDSGWADPNTVDVPGILSIRPGRAIRFGVTHITLGDCWVFRGFIDDMQPSYLPDGTDTVELHCVDALGEVNRAKFVPYDVPWGAGENATQRVTRILNLAMWPVAKRQIGPSSTALLGSDLGGQAADLLGVVSESVGGALFGDLEANVVFHGRDWQAYPAGTPPDGTIGNVDPGVPGYWIPGTPEVPAHLDTAAGVVSTVAPTVPAAQRQVTSDPAGVTVVDAGGVSTITGPNGLRWAQLDQINQRRFVFPGVAGNYLSVSNAANLKITGDIEIVARCDVRPTVSGVIYCYDGSPRGWRLYYATNGQINFNPALPGTSYSSTVVPGTAGAMTWIKMTRVAANGLISFYWAPDSPTEPMTWTAAGTNSSTAGNLPLPTTGVLATIAARAAGGSSEMFAGRIARVIVRDGIAGPTVLDVTESDAATVPAGATSFTAGTGQTVTVTQTAGNTIIQALPDQTVWRFDANDYPGSGLTYTDPRGRQWTLSAPGAVAPYQPATPPVWVPPVPGDVCPTSWTRPFDRADIATRVILGRDNTTLDPPSVPIQLDDQAGIALFGIEPFERTYLLTRDDDDLYLLAQRILETRGYRYQPRVRTVDFDAATSDTALDLMAVATPYLPSRYRCRLRLERGDIFDEEMFVTGLAHEIEPGRWHAQYNLDSAAPYAVADVRWDTAHWDRDRWTIAV
jgi:hypothetical protein